MSRETVFNQAATQETVANDILTKLNLFKTYPGIFYSLYGGSTGNSLIYTNDANAMLYSSALSDVLREKLLKDKCGSSINLNLTTRFSSITLIGTTEITFSNEFLTDTVQNSDFFGYLSNCMSRFIGIACALNYDGSTQCTFAFASSLVINSSYSATSLSLWTSKSAADWSQVFCSKIYCTVGEQISGCVQTLITKSSCQAAIPSCTLCIKDSSGNLL